VPYADFNLLKLPPSTEHEQDFTMLSDIFPTAYFGTDLAGVGPGDIVSHELPLTDAPGAYDKFDKRVDGYTKVILHPAA
jgi:threonine dehydrogenase-like Zn-dependent dehydrogenase